MEDFELIDGLKNQRINAFKELFLRHHEAVCSFAVDLGYPYPDVVATTDIVFYQIWQGEIEIDQTSTFQDFLRKHVVSLLQIKRLQNRS